MGSTVRTTPIAATAPYVEHRTFCDEDSEHHVRFQRALQKVQYQLKKEVDSEGCSLGEEELQLLAETLRGSSLCSLSLAGNFMTLEGAKYLLGSLQETSLKSLCVGWNNLGDEGAEAFAEALQRSPLEYLGLSCNSITQLGVRHLAASLKFCHLTSLDLGGNEISDQGVEHLAHSLAESNLSSLFLYSCGLRAEGVQALAGALKLSCLTRLDLSNNELRDEDLASLCEGVSGCGLMKLDLLGNECSDEFQEQLRAIMKTNKERSFVLQMQVDATDGFTLTFRTAAGNVAAVLAWESDRPAKDLPEAVLSQVRTSGFQLPCKHLKAFQLKIVTPSAGVLDVGPSAARLERQLGL